MFLLYAYGSLDSNGVPGNHGRSRRKGVPIVFTQEFGYTAPNSMWTAQWFFFFF